MVKNEKNGRQKSYFMVFIIYKVCLIVNSQYAQSFEVIFMQYAQAHERIKAARKQRKLSQKQMAELLEISQPGYQQLESGKYPDMKISTLVKLCEILNISADWVLGIESKCEQGSGEEQAQLAP